MLGRGSRMCVVCGVGGMFLLKCMWGRGMYVR